MEAMQTQEALQQAQDAGASEMEGKYLTFWTDGQLFGLPIVHVVQIVGMQPITEVPEFPHYAKGIVNLRGAIIPLVDIRLRLAKEPAEYNERTCIIVTNIKDNSVGLIVDEVDAVQVIADDLISPPPNMSKVQDAYITGIGRLEGKIVLLMDPQRIVGAQELQILQQSQT